MNLSQFLKLLVSFGILFCLGASIPLYAAEPAAATKLRQKIYNQCMVNQRATLQTEKFVSKFCKDEADQSIENLQLQAINAQRQIDIFTDQVKKISTFKPETNDEYTAVTDLFSSYQQLNDYFNIFLTTQYARSLQNSYAELLRLKLSIEIFNQNFIFREDEKQKAKEISCEKSVSKYNAKANAIGDDTLTIKDCLNDFFYEFHNLNTVRIQKIILVPPSRVFN